MQKSLCNTSFAEKNHLQRNTTYREASAEKLLHRTLCRAAPAEKSIKRSIYREASHAEKLLQRSFYREASLAEKLLQRSICKESYSEKLLQRSFCREARKFNKKPLAEKHFEPNQFEPIQEASVGFEPNQSYRNLCMLFALGNLRW